MSEETGVVSIGRTIRQAILEGEIEQDDHQAILDLASGLAALHIQPERTQGSIDPYSYAVGMAITMAHALLAIDIITQEENS